MTLTLAIPLVLAACGGATDPTAGATSGPTVSTVALEGRDAAAFQRWQAAGLLDYRFTVDAHCFCVDHEPTVVTVLDGVVESVVPAEPAYWSEVTVAVPDLFARIADFREQFDDVRVGYDGTLGYPTRIAIDRDVRAIDDEVTYVVTSFTPLA